MIPGRVVRGLLLLLLLAGAVVVGLPSRADAHALLQTSEPAAGVALDRSPTSVILVFGEAPDPGLSTIRVLDTSGASYARGEAELVADNRLGLRVGVRELGRGVYTVAWRAVSSVDGHLTTGSFGFGVGVAPGPEATATGATGVPRASVPGVIGRWLLYLGLVAAVGAGFVGAVVFAQAPSTLRRLLAAGWVAALIGTLVVAAVQRADAGVGVGALAGTAVGQKLLFRLLAIVDLGVVVVAVWFVRTHRSRRVLFGVAGISAVAAMVIDVLSSHAAAGSSPALASAVQGVHVVAVGFWIGGLAALLLATRGEPSDSKGIAWRRFSAGAGVALAAVVLTGTARAIAEVGSWEGLVTTGFGRLVIVKVALLVVLAALGGLNRWRNLPQIAQRLGPLRRLGSVEVVAGAAALLAAAGMVNLAPPSGAQAAGQAGPAPLVVSGADFGTTTRVRLEVSPGTAGFNRFRAQVTEYDTRAPVAADIVRLTFVAPSRPDVGQSTLTLLRTKPGAYEADGANLSLYGQWRIRVLVQRSTTSVEIPLTLTTRIPPQRVEVSQSPGTPDVFTVHVGGDRRLQVYLDPGTPGFNQLHLTYLDATGAPLEVKDAIVRRSEPRFAALPPLTVRRLETGHFVADVTVEKGSAEFEIVGTTAEGEQAPAHLKIEVR